MNENLNSSIITIPDNYSGGYPHRHDGVNAPKNYGEDLLLRDNTVNDSNTIFHGFLPKLTGNPQDYLRGDGTWGGPGSGDIVFDFAANVGATGGSTELTSFTNNGDILFVMVTASQGDTISSAPTYNGVSMTLLATLPSTTTWAAKVYYLIGPAMGTHNISVTMAGTHTGGGIAVSYLHTSQTSQPDASSASGSTTTTTHFTQSLITTQPNCYVIWFVLEESGLALTPDTGTIIRQNNGGNACFLAELSILKFAAGAVTLGVQTPSNTFAGVIISISPQ